MLSEVTVHRISSGLDEEYSALNNSCLKKHPRDFAKVNVTRIGDE